MKSKLPRRLLSWLPALLLLIGLVQLPGVVGSPWTRKMESPSPFRLTSKTSIRAEITSSSGRSTISPHQTAMAEALEMATHGHFTDAVHAARHVPKDLRAAAIASVFALWVDQDAQQAARSALFLSDSTERNAAWNAVIARWKETGPDQLAAFALSLDDKAAQQQALASAIPCWLDNNENDAVTWVSKLPHTLNCDQVISVVARYEPLIERDPDQALAWAAAIQDANLRSRTLGDVLRAWLPVAPGEAAHYARTSPDLLPSEREDILVGERFTDHP